MNTPSYKYNCIALAVCILLAGGLCITCAQPGVLVAGDKNTPASFPLVSNNSVASFYYDTADAKVTGIAARAFAGDINALTGKMLPVITSRASLPAYVVVAGTIGQNSIIDQLVRDKKIDISGIRNRWEAFGISIISGPFPGTQKMLVIAGSDRRGTAFGIFHLSRLLGISPFTWWADVVPKKRKQVYLTGNYISETPSVKYRGIFINDEDWGLQPWAAQQMDTAIKDIGPNTYAKVFELLLRLKANYIWPAMHPCTKAFYYYKENPVVADDYAIIVGGSHCEPMLRNNVFEWAENFEHEYGRKPGEWRYDINREEIYRYWNDRVKQSLPYQSVFTVGMRGIHDGSMPGPKDPDQKLQLLASVIADQRRILQLNFSRPAQEIPQIFVPYKEVLSLYRRGLPLDDDITIIWPDDNHGYIRQLPGAAERLRPGGHGVYYHLSYWGAPQDYLWLSSIGPSLIAYELTKAYRYNAGRLWVFNVGDIKPAEPELQYAMDLAWDIRLGTPANANGYMKKWATEIFGEDIADDIASIKNEYYLLAQSGKPEHIDNVPFPLHQLTERLARYNRLVAKARDMQLKVPASLQDAYYQLVLYPVLGAAFINKKILLARKSFTDTTNAAQYAQESRAAFDSIAAITSVYNTKITGGKWNGIMSWHPRNQAVFDMPETLLTVPGMKKDSLHKRYTAIADPSFTLTPSSFTRNQNSTAVLTVPGIGITGNGITLASTLSGPVPGSASALLEYALPAAPGSYRVVIKCLPAFDITNAGLLRYSISVNDETPQLVNLHAEADSREWRENVVRGYAAGHTQHVLQNTAINTLRIRIHDPNLVINTIEFYKQ